MMAELQNIITITMVTLGAMFILIGSIGIIRLPDFYSRTHAASKIDTLGIILTLGGLMVYEGFTVNTAKLLIAVIFVFIANPTGSHAIARAAYNFGLPPRYRKLRKAHNNKEGKNAH